MSERVANIERLASDLADREIEPDSADAEELKLAIRSLTAETQLVVREGLTFDYPDSTAIIPDTRCRSLRGFLGANWVAQEYLLTPDEIEEIYMVDVGTSYTAYNEDGHSTGYEPTAGTTAPAPPSAWPASGRSTTARTARFTSSATAIRSSCRSRPPPKPRSPGSGPGSPSC
jgi:hypothetical protein